MNCDIERSSPARFSPRRQLGLIVALACIVLTWIGYMTIWWLRTGSFTRDGGRVAVVFGLGALALGLLLRFASHILRRRGQ